MKKFKFLRKEEPQLLTVSNLQGAFVPICGSTVSNLGIMSNALDAMDELRVQIERLEEQNRRLENIINGTEI